MFKKIIQYALLAAFFIGVNSDLEAGRRYRRRNNDDNGRVLGGLFGGAATGALIGGIAGGGRGAGIGAGVGAGVGLMSAAASRSRDNYSYYDDSDYYEDNAPVYQNDDDYYDDGSQETHESYDDNGRRVIYVQ